MTDRIDVELRHLLAEVAGLDPAVARALPAHTPLLTGEIGLSSREGARLLVLIRERFGVDVAAEDLTLDSLESVGTLLDFVRTRHGVL